MNLWLTLSLALVLALIHILGKIRLVSSMMSKSWVLSLSGGIAVSYVFIHILPELSHHEAVLKRSSVHWLEFVEKDAYLAGMTGLVLYYGLQRFVRGSRKGSPNYREARIFWIHTGSFAVYNGLIGYLLVDRFQSGDLMNLLLYFAAMGMHFLVNDHALHEHHRDKYNKYGRWLLALSVLIGWGCGIAFDIPDYALSLLFAFLSGAILVNVMKEELPHQKQSSVWAFFLGALVYTVLLFVSNR
ncbi:hypothetical protein DNH61_03230 [Paenibacillus sambharensis]|uniref:ZIP Zinc transporter n=1 Tax=Paenibacillus sambharensis TaxID=1803190 RepID=A0A2W1LEW1_9BACL|nr:hypothetical protein [Paenibacillus sambharensis]PZD97373.1 hypothetical protein DNH61_03230 [Paenibacillus sambharensis]